MTDDSRDFHKPVRRPAEVFDRLFSAEDPAEVSRVAHATAGALLARVREGAGEDVVERLVAFTDDHGIDTIADLWSRAPARSLPGALWRLYLLQLMVHDDPQVGGAAVRARSHPPGVGRRCRGRRADSGGPGRAHESE